MLHVKNWPPEEGLKFSGLWIFCCSLHDNELHNTARDAGTILGQEEPIGEKGHRLPLVRKSKLINGGFLRYFLACIESGPGACSSWKF